MFTCNCLCSPFVVAFTLWMLCKLQPNQVLRAKSAPLKLGNIASHLSAWHICSNFFAFECNADCIGFQQYVSNDIWTMGHMPTGMLRAARYCGKSYFGDDLEGPILIGRLSAGKIFSGGTFSSAAIPLDSYRRCITAITCETHAFITPAAHGQSDNEGQFIAGYLAVCAD